ncbi:MAG: hypothetical protein IKM68_01895 [Bacteroidaceae bacterium]|nr:hypothetical protein [Prevotella sp.]MBR3856717.1 hypothetical protein [Bacteroidaceae bacterium]
MKAKAINELLGNMEGNKDLKALVEVHTIKSVYVLNFIDGDRSSFEVYEDDNILHLETETGGAWIDCDQVISIEV